MTLRTAGALLAVLLAGCTEEATQPPPPTSLTGEPPSLLASAKPAPVPDAGHDFRTERSRIDKGMGANDAPDSDYAFLEERERFNSAVAKSHTVCGMKWVPIQVIKGTTSGSSDSTPLRPCPPRGPNLPDGGYDFRAQRIAAHPKPAGCVDLLPDGGPLDGG